MRRSALDSLSLVLLLIIAAEKCGNYTFAHAKVHITDDLADVVDDEEDEAWKQWGKKKEQTEFDPPPDFTKMTLAEMQAEMMKRQFGPVFGFVKLRPGNRRTPNMVSEIATKWAKVARTGGIEAKFTGFDLSTIMVTMENGQDTLQLKEFVLEQEDAYEVKIGDQLFRRNGDPPFEEAVEKLRTDEKGVTSLDLDEASAKDEL